MALILKFLTENARFYHEDFWFLLLSLSVFAIMGFGGEKLPLYLFFFGNRKNAEKQTHQIYSFQGLCRFFFWLILIANAPFAILAVGYSVWKIFS